MNQFRFAPRQWALLVVAGGAFMALPFMQLAPGTSGDTPSEPASAGDLEALVDIAGQVGNGHPTAALASTGADGHSDSNSAIEESHCRHKLPAWAEARQSPFDELMQENVQLPTVAAPQVLPLQPLRPWITPPPKQAGESGLAEQAGAAPGRSLLASQDPASQAPWSDGEPDSSLPAPHAARDRLASSSSALSVNAWPDERFPAAQVARQLADKYPLQSALVPADQVLPPPSASGQLAASRQVVAPGQALVAEPRIHFGQSAPEAKASGASVFRAQASQVNVTPPPAMQPLPTLPPARQGHIIFQPR